MHFIQFNEFVFFYNTQWWNSITYSRLAQSWSLILNALHIHEFDAWQGHGEGGGEWGS